MIVLDEEAYRWILLEEDGLFLNAFCSHSAADYFFLMPLNDEELNSFRTLGRSYPNDLAYKVHYSTPGVRGNRSPFNRAAG